MYILQLMYAPFLLAGYCIIAISFIIIYVSKLIARLLEKAYAFYKVKKANKQKELQKIESKKQTNENKLDNKTIEKEVNSFDIER